MFVAKLAGATVDTYKSSNKDGVLYCRIKDNSHVPHGNSENIIKDAKVCIQRITSKKQSQNLLLAKPLQEKCKLEHALACSWDCILSQM